MSAKRDDQTTISKSLKPGTLPTFTMLRSLLSVEKVARELVYRNFPVQASSATHSIAQFRIQEMSLINRLGNRDKTEP